MANTIVLTVLLFAGRKHGGGTYMVNTIDTMVHAILMGHGISMASAEIMMNNVCYNNFTTLNYDIT